MSSPFVPPRQEFPLLSNREQIAYLDNAATTQKPKVVLDALADFYSNHNANVHRSAHAISDEATQLFEDARQHVSEFLGARTREEVIWTRGTTESINLVAQSFAPKVLSKDSTIVISVMEHHSNIVPWQLACERTGARLRAVRVTPSGCLDLDHYRELLRENVRIVALGHVSNALGTVNPIEEIVEMAHHAGARVLLDGAQAAAHVPIDVSSIDCDFYAFSGHKAYGPTGIGVLYGKLDLLESMPPWQGGGEMIEHVTVKKSTFQPPPFRFEAGTPDISGPVGLQAALSFLSSCVENGLYEYENLLLQYATSSLKQIEGLRIVGEAPQKSPIVSFLVEGTHPNDLATMLDQQHVAIRAGHHCTIPLMEHFGIPGTIRASFGLYNLTSEVDRLVEAIHVGSRILKG